MQADQRNVLHQRHEKPYALILAIAVVVVLSWAFNLRSGGKFLALSNLNLIVSHAVIPAFVAWGLSFVFACGYTDLSVGAILILGANMAGTLGNAMGLIGVILGGIATAILLTFLNFAIFTTTGIPSWIVGIGMAMIYEAMAAFYSKSRVAQGLTVVNLKSELMVLGHMPYIYIVFTLGFLLAYVVYNKTTLGLNMRAVGSNGDVARAMGINAQRTLLRVGVVCGLFFGCAAFLNECYTGRVFAKTGLSSMSAIFQPLAALLLAQVLQGRMNLIVAIPLCSVFVYAIFNMLTIAGVPSGTWQEAVLGLTVVLFGIVSQRHEKGIVK